jgi:paraquat-inducible protein B
VAIGIAASMLVRSVFLTGPRIEIEFKSADAVEAGKTEVRYKEVVDRQGRLGRPARRPRARRRRRPARPPRRALSRSTTRASGSSSRASARVGERTRHVASGAYIGTDAGV